MTFEDFIGRFPDFRRVGDGEVRARCPLPGHRDSDPSVSIKRAGDKILLFDHAGCPRADILAAIGCTMADLFVGNGDQGASARSRIVAVYDYTDERGEVLYQSCRMEPKDFRQRRPDGKGGYLWTLGDVRRVPYRLHELQNRADVVNAEGEKDADNLWRLGFAATTNAGGAGKWTAALTADLLRAGVERVVVLPDNDPPGRKHAQAVAHQLVGAGIAVKILELPGLPVKGDVSEWLEAGGTREQLEALIAAAPHVTEADLVDEYEAPGAGDGATGNRPTARGPIIDAGEQDLAQVADAAWRAEKLVFGKYVTKPAHPPIAVVRDMLARPDAPLPQLVRVVEVPIFTPAGTVLSRPGYDPVSGVLFAPPAGLVFPQVPEEPTADDLGRARALLLEELLPDFPFTGPAERAAAVAMLIEPFVRDLIEGPTPLYLIEKPSPGTGASLLGELPAQILTGRPGAAMTEGRDEDEWRKRITSKLITGAPIILLDNVRRRLDSAAVSSAITALVWEDRQLGQSAMVRVRVRCTWIATANNPSLSAEMVRRAVRIRLDAKVDRPWLRDVDAFRHPDLRAWVQRSRGDLVWAALVLGQAWLAQGRPAADVHQLGMFEGWSQVMGGILAAGDITGFLSNLDEFYSCTDGEGAEIRTFLAAWWEKHRDAEVTAAQLFTLATAPESSLDIDAKTEQGRKVRFGKLLSDLRDRRYRLTDQLFVTVAQAGTYQRAALWRLLAGESVSLGESVSPFRTRAREEFIGGGETHQHSQTHQNEPDWVRDDLFGGQDR